MKSPFVSRKKHEEDLNLLEIRYKNTVSMLEKQHKEEKEKILKDLPEILKNFNRLCTDIDIDRMSQGLMWGNDDYWIQYIAENVKRQIIQSLKSRNCFREVDETDRRGYGYFDKIYNTSPSSNYLKD